MRLGCCHFVGFCYGTRLSPDRKCVGGIQQRRSGQHHQAMRYQRVRNRMYQRPYGVKFRQHSGWQHGGCRFDSVYIEFAGTGGACSFQQNGRINYHTVVGPRISALVTSTGRNSDFLRPATIPTLSYARQGCIITSQWRDPVPAFDGGLHRRTSRLTHREPFPQR